MNKDINKVFMTVLTLVLLSAFSVYAGQKSVQTEDAKKIIRAAGIQGGLIVHIPCGNGKLTAALHANDSYLVHGLDRNEKNVKKAREYIMSCGIYDKVSVDELRGNKLPYIDNLINLVVSEKADLLSMDEIMRVLCPGGVAYIKQKGNWEKTIKPRSKDIDEWTHYLHGPDGNAVSNDLVVGPPRHMQWVGSPNWARHHDHMASMSALVSANGRIFYIMDEGSKASIQLLPKWFLTARDAFSGVILWKRPIPSWNTHLWPLKSGPAQVTRRLIAMGNRIYATLELNAPVTAIDAVTGNTLKNYESTKNTEELIASDGVLFMVVKDDPVTWNDYRSKFTYVWDNMSFANTGWAWDEGMRRIIAVEAETGKILWQKNSPITPLTLATDAKKVIFHDGERIVCLDRKNGKETWKSEPITRRIPFPVCFGARLIIYKDVVLFAGGNLLMTALSAQTGKVLWSANHPRSGHNSLEDLIVIDDLVWSGAIALGNDSGAFKGRDLYTGEVKNEFIPDVKTYWFHHRCYPSKATVRYILPSRTGIEFVDFRSRHWTTNHWVRGGCIYGIMPCNGLVYAPPHSCACYLEAKLNGFCALAPESNARNALKEVSNNDKLERGPAYTESESSTTSTHENPDDWPTYRHDVRRSGFTKTTVPSEIKPVWETKLGGKLTSLVIADGKVFVASIETHTLFALEMNSGKILWSYTTGGRIDSPPTIYQGRVLFGSADGWVYCLRASDGILAWRFRAAPEDLRLMAYEQLESVWPIHGNILVQDGNIYFVAGRSMFLDGGLRFFRLDPKTGKKLTEVILDDRDPVSGDNLQIYVNGLNMPVALPDILSSDGQHIYMRSQRFDLKGNRQQIAPADVTNQEGEGIHLFSPTGFLDDTYFHRSYWMYGKSVASGWGGWFRAGRFVPSGQILVFDESSIYGFSRKPEYLCQSSVLEYYLFAADNKINNASIRQVTEAEKRMNATSEKGAASAADWKLRKGFPMEDRTAVRIKWSLDQPPLLARAMVLTGRTLFIAGPHDIVNEEDAFYHPDDPEIKKKLEEQNEGFDGKKGAILLALSASDGKKLAEYKMDNPPVFDGIASAGGRLYIALMDGRLICMGK